MNIEHKFDDIASGIVIATGSKDTESDARPRDKLNAAIISLEISPFNEFARFGSLGAAMALTGSNPTISSLTITAVTAALEVPAAIAAADALENSARLNQGIEKVNSFTDSLKDKFGIDKSSASSMPTKAGLAYFGGSAVSTIVKHREDTARTKEQNSKYGLRAAGALVGVSAVQGYLIADGIKYPSPEKLAGAALAVGSIIGAARLFKAWVKRDRKEQE